MVSWLKQCVSHDATHRHMVKLRSRKFLPHIVSHVYAIFNRHSRTLCTSLLLPCTSTYRIINQYSMSFHMSLYLFLHFHVKLRASRRFSLRNINVWVSKNFANYRIQHHTIYCTLYSSRCALAGLCVHRVDMQTVERYRVLIFEA